MLSKGLAYENIALKYLEKHHLTLVKKNFHTRFGEIDLIMKDGDILTFVEVRYRKNASHGSASESVNLSKQKKIIKTAEIFLMQNNGWHLNSRFDVIAISPATLLPFKHQIDWYKAAFTC
ncbi:MAG: putative endonuclease [Oleiphilaceae bacterium]|jgi:putative endonuclease